MSVSVIRYFDSRLDTSQPNRVFSSILGPTLFTCKHETASTSSNSLIQYNITTTSPSVGVCKRMGLENTFYIKCKDVHGNYADAAPARLVNNCGIRQYPLHAVLDSAKIEINDTAITEAFRDIIHPLMMYSTDLDDRDIFMSQSPHYPDNYFSYTQPIAGIRDPHSTYFNSSPEITRNAQIWIEPVASDPKTLKFVSRCDLMMSPFDWSQHADHSQCFFGLKSIKVALTPSAAYLTRLLSGTEGAWVGSPQSIFPTGTIEGMEVNVSTEQSEHQIIFHYLTPFLLNRAPSTLYYPYYKTERQELPVSTDITGGLTREEIMNTFNLSYVPKRMYLMVMPNITKFTTKKEMIETPNFFGRIDHVNIGFDNNSNMLNELNSFDLWKMSVRNGLRQSWSEWNNFKGGPLCISFGEDICLNSPMQSESVQGSFTIQIKVTFTDLRPAGSPPIKYNILALFLVSGYMLVNNMQVECKAAVLTETLIAQATGDNGSLIKTGLVKRHIGYTGAGFFGSLWKGIKNTFGKVKPIINETARLVGDIAPMLPLPPQLKATVPLVSSVVQRATGGRKRATAKGGKRVRCSSLRSRI